MKQDKIIVFENKKIRRIWHEEGWQTLSQSVTLKREGAVYIKAEFEGEYGGTEYVITNPIFFFCTPECCSSGLLNNQGRFIANAIAQ